jgi:hypothetical protein
MGGYNGGNGGGNGGGGRRLRKVPAPMTGKLRRGNKRSDKDSDWFGAICIEVNGQVYVFEGSMWYNPAAPSPNGAMMPEIMNIRLRPADMSQYEQFGQPQGQQQQMNYGGHNGGGGAPPPRQQHNGGGGYPQQGYQQQPPQQGGGYAPAPGYTPPQQGQPQRQAPPAGAPQWGGQPARGQGAPQHTPQGQTTGGYVNDEVPF